MRRSGFKSTGMVGSLWRVPFKRKPSKRKFPKVPRKVRLARKRKRGTSEQTRKRYKDQRIWSRWIRQTQVAYLYQTKGLIGGRCEKCGALIGLEADHVIPKSSFRIILNNPTNGQVLCHWCNSQKGSTHTKTTDYRKTAMKLFYIKISLLHWEQYGTKGIWQINDQGAVWVRSRKIIIPGAQAPIGQPT